MPIVVVLIMRKGELFIVMYIKIRSRNNNSIEWANRALSKLQLFMVTHALLLAKSINKPDIKLQSLSIKSTNANRIGALVSVWWSFFKCGVCLATRAVNGPVGAMMIRGEESRRRTTTRPDTAKRQ